MKFTKDFTREELLRSATADLNKIKNIPDEKAESQLRRLCEEILQPIRDHWKNPIVVTSGYRSVSLNRMVGGVATSQHVKGEAADIIAMTSSIDIPDTFHRKQWNRELFKVILELIENKKIRVGQLINEKNFSWIHISLPDKNHNNEILNF